MSDEFRLRDGVITKMVGTEMVLLDYERGIYYGLNDVGARALSMVAGGTPWPDVIDRLLEEFEVSRDTLLADLQKLVAELRRQELITSA